MDKQFKIIATTNPYIAQRDGKIFKGKTKVILYENLNLDQAKEKLESMANEDYENEGGIDWSNHSEDRMSYEWDSRYFRIEEMPVLTFSIKTYNSNAQIRIDSTDENVDWVCVDVEIDSLDREDTTEQNLNDIKNLDILPVIPGHHVIDQDSFNQMLDRLKIWIDPHCK